jgi:protein-tyrosine kinase
LLLRSTLAVLLAELRSDFDVILFDTPPAKLYADAQSLAFRAGSVMVMARKDRTAFADAATVIRELSNSGARIIGTVFNAF